MGRLGAVALTLLGVVLLNILGHCETSIYPGLRRKPLQPALQPPFDVSSDFLAQLMEENARRRLQHQFEQQLELINLQMNRQRQRQEQHERYRQQQLLQRQRQRQLQELAEEEQAEDEENASSSSSSSGSSNTNNNNVYDQYDNMNPNSEFSFKYPNLELDGDLLRQRIPFAVGPTDPRFYEEENRDEADLDSRALDEYEEYVPAESKQTATVAGAASAAGHGDNKDMKPLPAAPATEQVQVLTPVEASKVSDNAAAAAANFHRIKPQSAAAAAVAGVNVQQAAAAPARHDINALIDKLQKEGKSNTIINGNEAVLGQDAAAHMVLRQHLGIEGDTSMYVVALIAGVSAAITVGLIALGIAWLHNKTKAAADVDYPAYGVTGPNKDISPSGDRKLAQSAQMYHYQHQKQQIIAMENRQAVEGSCGLSDVESDDDNEEGDYTVYECPGLAPTGEMEVKNPLFLDETPVTPGTTLSPTNNMTQATPQQPTQQVIKKIIVKATPPMGTSSDEHKKKKNKK